MRLAASMARSGPRSPLRRAGAGGIGMAQKCRNTLLKSRSGFDDIERMGHAGWRRIMIERYRVGEEVRGIAAYLRDSGGVRLDHDEVFGTLWRRSVARRRAARHD